MKRYSLGFPWAMPFGCPAAGIGLVCSQHLHLGDTSTGGLRGPPAILRVTPCTFPWGFNPQGPFVGCPCAHPAPGAGPTAGPSPRALAGQDPPPAPCWVGSGTRRLFPDCPLIRLLLDLFVFPKMFCTEIFFFFF